jgi:UDP-GlcNAc3NAcA epimerase
MIQALDPILLSLRPEVVVVYGDTNSTLAGALSAVKLHIATAHVEAGLRSFNRRMPEEINRVLADHMSDVLFAPTEVAVDNLKREGIDGAKVQLVGDVMFDNALFYGGKAERKSRILDRLGLERGGYVLTTIHRAENTDSSATLSAIFAALAALARQFKVVMPLHPRTRSVVDQDPALRETLAEVRITEPLGYLDMVSLERNARIIVTDSGGVQKEAFFYRVPCVTLRGETEWTELVELGWNRLVPPTSQEAIQRGIQEALSAGPGRNGAPYGSGESSRMIADRLLKS